MGVVCSATFASTLVTARRKRRVRSKAAATSPRILRPTVTAGIEAHSTALESHFPTFDHVMGAFLPLRFGCRDLEFGVKSACALPPSGDQPPTSDVIPGAPRDVK